MVRLWSGQVDILNLGIVPRQPVEAHAGVSEAVGGQGVPRNARRTDAHRAGRSFASTGWCARDHGYYSPGPRDGILRALVHLSRCPRSSPPVPGYPRVIENWCLWPL